MHNRPYHRLTHWLSHRLTLRVHHRISYLPTALLLLAMLVGCAPMAEPDGATFDPTELASQNFIAANFMSRLLTISNSQADAVSEGANCLVTGEGTGFSSRGGGEGIPDNLVHGQFVWETLQKYLGQEVNGFTAAVPHIDHGVQAFLADSSTVITEDNLPVVIFVIDEFRNPELNINYYAPSQLYVIHGVDGEHYILIQAVDIEQFNLIQVSSQLQNAIANRKIRSQVSDEQPIWLPPLQEFVLNMSWIIVPCDKLPEDAELTDYFDTICRTASPQEEEDLSRLSEVISAVNLVAAGGEATNPNEVTLSQLCDQLLAQNLFRSNMNRYFSPINQRQKVDVVALFALRSDRLRGVYDGLAQGEVSTAYTRPQGNLGYQAINCLTNDATIDDAASSDLSADCTRLRSNIALTAIDQVIPVAAAGNDKRLFPYLPAAWDSVLSVGAINYDSNFAEIWMNGESAAPDPENVWKGGSSFAAPRLSVWAALYLSVTRYARCLSTPDVKPVLGIKGDWNALVTGEKNRPLRDAAAVCPEFENLVTTFAP